MQHARWMKLCGLNSEDDNQYKFANISACPKICPPAFFLDIDRKTQDKVETFKFTFCMYLNMGIFKFAKSTTRG